jgi:hypothetical protein
MTAALSPSVDFVDSTPILDDPAALRARADELGYLFFRGLLPADEVLDLRRRMLQVLAERGWLADASAGTVDHAAFGAVPAAEREFCGVGIPAEAYRAIQRIEQFHQLAHHPRLLQVFGGLFGRPVLPHPRNIARIMIPATDSSPTPPHQDFIHIQGTKNVWTAWFPLGDCPVELGGLTALAGSQRDGVLSYKAADGAGGLEAYLCDLDYPWAMGPYSAGDVLTFSCQTVHRALPNQYPDQVRLSCDYRYQPADEDIHEGSVQVHCNVDSWDDIYAGWADRSLAYYWQDRELRFSEWDERVRWQKNKIC